MPVQYELRATLTVDSGELHTTGLDADNIDTVGVHWSCAAKVSVRWGTSATACIVSAMSTL